MLGKKKEQNNSQDEVDAQRRENAKLLTYIIALRKENESLLELNEDLRKNVESKSQENDRLKEQLDILTQYLTSNNIDAKGILKTETQDDNNEDDEDILYLSKENTSMYS